MRPVHSWNTKKTVIRGGKKPFYNNGTSILEEKHVSEEKFNFNEVNNVEKCYSRSDMSGSTFYSTTIPFVIIKVICIRKYVIVAQIKNNVNIVNDTSIQDFK